LLSKLKEPSNETRRPDSSVGVATGQVRIVLYTSAAKQPIQWVPELELSTHSFI
jgi:hypothetical protein